MLSSRKITLPVIAAVVLAMCGCTTTQLPIAVENGNGSLAIHTGGFRTCTIVRPPAKGIVTGYHIENVGLEPLTLTSIRLTESTGLGFLDSVVLPEYAGIGTMNYPLTGEEITNMWWDRRKPVKGYLLQARQGAEIELAVGLEKGKRKGSFTDFVIDYVDSSGNAMVVHSADTQLDVYMDGECEEEDY